MNTVEKIQISQVFNSTYSIPLYQRAYAWTEKEINQLIDDIYGIDDNTKKYCLGSLIVDKKDFCFEVIDGQQRLTTLYILLNCLNIEPKCPLTFECRKKSNYTLENIKEQLDNDLAEESIIQGIKAVKKKLCETDIDTLCEKLEKVYIYRIEVPKNTDLNHYFEIMNTRTEQLEQHDILKAKLMENIGCEKERSLFACIWNACSDMTGYVQMHLPVNLRNDLFGTFWENCPQNLDVEFNIKSNENTFSLQEAIKADFSVSSSVDFNEKDERVRFESIIDFPFFLLHTLRAYYSLRMRKEDEKKPFGELIDDKKLTSDFLSVIKKTENKEEFAKDFILFLLQARFMLDKYIIKREFKYSAANSDGEWSLKELKVSKNSKKVTSYYSDTNFTVKREHNQEKNQRKETKKILCFNPACVFHILRPKVCTG